MLYQEKSGSPGSAASQTHNDGAATFGRTGVWTNDFSTLQTLGRRSQIKKNSTAIVILRKLLFSWQPYLFRCRYLQLLADGILLTVVVQTVPERRWTNSLLYELWSDKLS
jgi:hypothetical protein